MVSERSGDLQRKTREDKAEKKGSGKFALVGRRRELGKNEWRPGRGGFKEDPESVDGWNE